MPIVRALSKSQTRSILVERCICISTEPSNPPEISEMQMTLHHQINLPINIIALSFSSSASPSKSLTASLYCEVLVSRIRRGDKVLALRRPALDIGCDEYITFCGSGVCGSMAVAMVYCDVRRDCRHLCVAFQGPASYSHAPTRR